jgi:hypothetical protein
MAPEIYIQSSHGQFTVDLRGFIIESQLNCTKGCEGCDDLKRIERFDLVERASHAEVAPFSHIDILDIGYWYRDAEGEMQYEPPLAEWRDEIAI